MTSFAPPGEILGCARWTRRPSKDDAASDPWIRRLSLTERVEGWLRWAELQWEERLRINPARAWDREDAFMRSIMTSTAFKPVRGATHWYLDHLAVAPEYQRRGVGKELVQWGLQRAEAETRERMKMWKAASAGGFDWEYHGVPSLSESWIQGCGVGRCFVSRCSSRGWEYDGVGSLEVLDSGCRV